MPDNISFLWKDSRAATQFSTAVCLHGHTLHSEECLNFLPTYLHMVPGISQIVRYYQSEPRPVDFARAYWTPPLTPASALQLEQEQTARLGLRPFVSLTDHDNIEAGFALQVTADSSTTPISVEWTVPYRRTFFHLGIHNLPPANARAWLSAMAAFTAKPREDVLAQILSALARLPEVLIVLNHPFWLEEGVRESDHRQALPDFLMAYVRWFDAFELNGTRRWHENREALELARAWSRPAISGGDRHAGEPSACLNLTNGRTFAEFVSEIKDGRSSLLFLPHYREPMALRVLEAAWDILRPYPEYPGRERWTDRIFYRGEDGGVRSLARLWQDRIPLVIRPAMAAVQFFASRPLRGALRFLLSRSAEV